MTDYAFQEAGIKWLRRHPRSVLGDDPGLGKTRQLILAAVPPVLVVSPADLEDTWVQEIRKWRPALELDYTWTSYQSLVGRKPNAKGHMRLLDDRPAPEFSGQWATTICDEAHHLKGRKTNWALAVSRLRTNRLWLATGTPVPNWAHEIFMLLRLLYPKDPRFTNYWNWARQWFQVDRSFVGGKHFEIGDLHPHLTWEEFVVGNGLDEAMLRRERDEVLTDLPPMSITERRLTMTPTQKRAYLEMKLDYLAWLDQSDTEVIAWNDGARHTNLAKLAVGPELLNPAEKPGCKMLAWGEILDENKGQPVVGFCHHRAAARAAEGVAQQRGRRAAVIAGYVSTSHRDEYVQALQAGELDVLIGTFETLTEGRTLTAASVCVRIERSWKPSKNDQAIHRLRRIGQTRPVHVIDLITKGTVDAGMLRDLAGKTDQQAKLYKAAAFAALLDG